MRYTTDGLNTWDIVKPQGNQNPPVNYNYAWTLESGKSLLFGNGATLVYDNATNTTSSAPFTTTNVKAIAEGTTT